MLAKAPEIRGAVDRDVVEAGAFTAWGLALHLLVNWVKGVVVLVPVITETLGARPDLLALSSVAIDPLGCAFCVSIFCLVLLVLDHIIRGVWQGALAVVVTVVYVRIEVLLSLGIYLYCVSFHLDIIFLVGEK